MGESAGASSIMHHLTAYGGVSGISPFQQAILQSPAFQPIYNNSLENNSTAAFLSALNVQTIDEARGLSSDLLHEVNTNLVTNATYSTFGFGPSVDGDFIPDLAGKLFLHGRFDHDIKVMVSHNANEGNIFAAQNIASEFVFEAEIRLNFPYTAQSVLDDFFENIYPPDFSGAHGYYNEEERFIQATADYAVVCNTYYIAKAYNNETYNYIFSMPPALHGLDVPYTFYNKGSSPDLVGETNALDMQTYITNFVRSGDPNKPNKRGPNFPVYGDDAQVLRIEIPGDIQEVDDTPRSRCNWWQQALYQTV
jgi:carboxylesterase type B